MASQRVALVGTGMVAGTYADAIANTGGAIELAAVMSRSGESSGRFIEKYRDRIGEPRICESIEEIAADSSIDFAILVTPPNARREIVECLASAGKPILMEKPVERTLDAATALVEFCEQAQVPLGIMFQHRARPSAARLREWMSANDAGPLRAVEITVPWWRPQSYYDELGRGSYARDGGGVLISQAIHTLDLALTFTGPVSEVSAHLATTGFHRMEAEDFVSAGMTLANGASGMVFASTASHPGRTEEIHLHFDRASIRLQSALLEIRWQDGREESHGASSATGAGADPMAFTSDWHRAMIEDFAAALAGKRAPIATGRSALAVHRLIEAMERSGKSGMRVRVLHGD